MGREETNSEVNGSTHSPNLLSWLRINVFFSAPKYSGSSHYFFVFILLKGPVADATDAPQLWGLIVQPYEEDDEDDAVFSAFPF
jgi:hypothetical protein